jgi:mono/diheme cytochrome c family protein
VAAQAGAALYEPQCAACHGTDGGGGLPNTPDFTAAQVQDDLRANTSDYFCILAEGTGAMPGFRRTLTDEEMWQVIVFLGSLVP